MAFVSAVLCILGISCVLNLSLTMAVLRRLADHEERLGREASGSTMPELAAMTGRPVPRFTAATIDGRMVGTDKWPVGAPTMIAFLSVTCDACHEQLPTFIELAAEKSHDWALAVISGPDAEARRMADAIGNACPAVAGADAREMVATFSINVFPTFLTIGADGRIASANTAPDGTWEVEHR